MIMYVMENKHHLMHVIVSQLSMLLRTPDNQVN